MGSFIAGTLAIIGLMLVAPTLARFAVKFGPAEYFSLMVLGLSILTYLSHGSLLKALIMACFGLILGLVGLDSISAVARLTFDRMELVDGVGLVPIVMGLFGIAEILVNLEQKLTREMFAERITGLLPSRQDWKESAAPLARGSVLGFVLGILPGGGAVIASFLSYAVEKRVSKTPEKFGKGAIAGVAGPEAANNAAAGSGFIPLLTLGIPPNVVTRRIATPGSSGDAHRSATYFTRRRGGTSTTEARRRMELDDITGAIVDAAVQIHRARGPGLFESLYEALLAAELQRRGLCAERQRTIGFCYDGVHVEDAFRADLLVERCVIVEVKSLERLAPIHTKQLLTYLRLMDLRVGLLLNFGAEA